LFSFYSHGTCFGKFLTFKVIEKIGITAKRLSPSEKTPTIMCMVYSMEISHATSIRAIRETWAPYCDGFLVFSTANDPRIPAISLPHDGPEQWHNMWQKIRSILKFVGTHYLDKFDFFYQGGDDMFVIPQNLKRYLQEKMDDDRKTPEDDYFVGRRFHGPRGTRFGRFNVGGPGYALSRGTLRKYVNEGWNNTGCSPNSRVPEEDIKLSQCLLKVFGIGLTDTRDHELRERFHNFPPDVIYQWRPPADVDREYNWSPFGKGANEWYLTFNREWPPLIAEMCCSPDTVSFHYIKQPAMVRHLHALIHTCDIAG
jgi:glycoprotein-N-acetylgalactosamine 3-beta-galactosyltransferase